jgi:hypothetical protein
MPLVRPARSCEPRRNQGPPDDSASGSGVKRCGNCARAAYLTKQVIHNGMQLLRIRYGLPYVELPDCGASELSRLLSYLLLQGKERPPVVFPRRRSAVRSNDGLIRLIRLERRERWALAHGLSSIKRNLPLGCPAHTPSAYSAWKKNVCSLPPPVSDEYLQHVRRVCTRIFSPSWDSRYDQFVFGHAANASAREPQLSRADVLWSGRREEFINSTLSETELPRTLGARYKEVASNGKCRPLLIFDENVELLAPLHKCVYSHLRRQPWLLCGPPTDDRMASVCAGRIQTSVDLVAATDNLSHRVAEVILETAFFTSVKVPRSIRSLAFASLAPIFRDREGSGYLRVTHGQMMGSYLSFPLLCLQSYCAASWAARFDPDARFLVNGDDCVISASRGIDVQDYPSGYRLNVEKTIRAEGVVEVNSTAFLRTGGRWREVRHLRRGGAPTSFAGMLHMADACSRLGDAWEDAFARSRIGRRWGFLPSQVGHTSYASYLRERQLQVRRFSTVLPCNPVSQVVPASLRRVYGRDARPEEVEALRSWIWSRGRYGGMKRDEWNPSCGFVRRTYGYRARPCNYFLSFVKSKKLRQAFGRPRKARFFLLPEEFDTVEEKEGLKLLEVRRCLFSAGLE